MVTKELSFVLLAFIFPIEFLTQGKVCVGCGPSLNYYDCLQQEWKYQKSSWDMAARGYSTAITYFEDAENGGYRPVCTALGKMYTQGLGVEQDDYKAFLYFDTVGARESLILKVSSLRDYAIMIELEPQKTK